MHGCIPSSWQFSNAEGAGLRNSATLVLEYGVPVVSCKVGLCVGLETGQIVGAPELPISRLAQARYPTHCLPNTAHRLLALSRLMTSHLLGVWDDIAVLFHSFHFLFISIGLGPHSASGILAVFKLCNFLPFLARMPKKV